MICDFTGSTANGVSSGSHPQEERRTSDAASTSHWSSHGTAATSVPVNQSSQRFPEKLFRLLDRADAECFNNIISWQPHGRSFVVRDRETFKLVISALMPGMTKWKSFQRQLHLWGFTRLTEGRDFYG
jgi:HSF-type DNA-binding